MNRNKKIFVGVFVAAAFFLLTSSAQAWPKKGDSGPSEEMREKWRQHVEEMYKDLGLTDEQQQQLKAQRESNRQGMKELFENIRAKRQELKQALEEAQLDMPKIQQIHEQLKALLAQKEDQRLSGILQVRKILTQEQFKKFHEKMQDKREKEKESFKEGHKRRWMG